MSADTNASPTTYSSLPYLMPSFDYHNCAIARFYRVLQLFNVYFEYQSVPLSHNPVATALHNSRSSLRSYLICWLFTDYFCDNTVRFARSKLSWADIALCTCGTVAMFPSPSLNHFSFFYHGGLQLRSSLRYRNTQRFLMNYNTKNAQSLHLLAVKALRRRVYRPMTLESTTLDQQAFKLTLYLEIHQRDLLGQCASVRELLAIHSASSTSNRIVVACRRRYLYQDIVPTTHTSNRIVDGSDRIVVTCRRLIVRLHRQLDA